MRPPPMSLQEEMKRELERVEAVLPHVKWQKADPAGAQAEDPTVKAYLGLAPGWRFTVVSYNIEPQGFPAGSRGYDGAAVHDPGVMVHLTRPLAERAFKLAEGAE